MEQYNIINKNRKSLSIEALDSILSQLTGKGDDILCLDLDYLTENKILTGEENIESITKDFKKYKLVEYKHYKITNDEFLMSPQGVRFFMIGRAMEGSFMLGSIDMMKKNLNSAI